jgi:asparagine synthase (glutamine-hydrolysing)
MCGIAGFQGEKTELLLSAMAQAISHRGPDNLQCEYIADEKLGLSHSRLSIIDLSSSSNQPLWDVKRSHCISFNGEIYNYKDLRDGLVAKGYEFQSAGDAEVLLNLYIEYGVKGFSKLNGIYAFAIWDASSKELLVARDPLGVKPLYYSESSTGFVFASELKSLLQDTSISRELDRTALSHYLRYLWCPAPLTPLKAVKKLEPGCVLLVKNGVIASQTKFYQLPQSKIPPCSQQQATDDLLSSLKSSVERQLVADVKVGAFLSGGLDSSAIVALAAKHVGAENLPCYTIDFDGGSAEGMQADLPYAKKVAKHLGVPLEIIKVESNIIEDLPQLIYQLDEPQADVAPLNAWYISRLAREQGVKVLLSGAGGDDLLTGYRRHYALSKEAYWQWLPKPFRFLLEKGSAMLPKSLPIMRRIAKAFEYASLDQSDRLATYFHWLNKDTVNRLFREPLLDLHDPLVDHIRSLPDEMSPLQKMLSVDAKYFLTDHNFNYTDKVSMAEGVEVRVPLVDLEMVETAARIPDEFKQHGSHGKWIFKKAMESYLPHDVIYRPKTGFGAPVRPWIRNELRSTVDDLLSDQSIKARGLFDEGQVRQLIDDDRAGKIDAAYTILSLMSIELWCRQFVDKPVPSPGI